jgi:hydrogenase-4 component F
MDPIWLKMCFLLILVGYSVKMGIAPLFTVDIDAKDAAPSPIGAIFSGGLLNVGFVAIFRFYEIFAGTSIHPWMNKILMIVGIVSILFAAVYIFKIRNYKRMLAYSSVEHAGIVLLAISCGGIGYFVAIFHLILHAFTKASLFYQMGQLYRVFRGKSMEDVGGYFKLNPYGAASILLGFFCITAMPPSGLFITEFLTFKSLLKEDHLIIAIFILLLLTIIVAALGKNFFKLLFTPLPHGTDYYESVSPFESLSQWALLLVVIYMGINPPVILVDFIQDSVQHLPNVVKILHHEII